MTKRIFKYLLRFFIAIFILLAILVAAIQLPFVQNKLVQLVSKSLSKSLNTEVSIGNVSIDFLTRVKLNDILIRDYKKDTLIYAGNVTNKHLLTFDWNKPIQFNGEKLILSDVKFYLDNTVKDSIFNLTKTFRKSNVKSENTLGEATPEDNRPKLDFIRLGQLDLSNVSFRLRDHYNYQTISFQIEHLDLDAKKWRFSDSIWQLGNLRIQKPLVSIIQHPSPYTPKSYKPEYLNLPFQLHLDQLKLEHAQLRIFNEEVESIPKDQLSFSDLDVRNIFLDAASVELRKGSIAGAVTHMRAIEKSGLGITDLRTQFFMNSYKTEAKNLLFKTNNSKIKGYLRFNYNHMREYLRFAAWVKVTGDVSESNLSLKDLAYFTPNLKNWSHLDVKFNTIARGTMNELMLNNLYASLNENSIKVGGQMKVLDLFSGKGLNTIAQLNRLSFEKKDIEFIFQKKELPAEIDRLGRMTYNGEFKGNPTKFTLNGKLLTSHGTGILKEMQFDFNNPNLPKYKGGIQVQNLKLNDIIAGGSPIDALTALVYIDGEGFNVQNLNSYIKGDIAHVHINGTEYRQFKVDGKLTEKIFNGDIKSLDPSLSFHANGKVSINEATPKLELQVDLENVDLQKLGLTKKKLHLYANVYGIGRGKNLDEMLGTMNLKDMYVIDRSVENKMYGFSNLTVEKDVFEESGNKYILLNSDEVQASLIGQYRVSDIPNLLTDYFLSYLAINKSTNVQRIYKSTFFNLSLDIKNIRNYSVVLHPSLKNIAKGTLNARFNGIENKMIIDGNFEQTEYLGFKFPKLNLANISSNSDFQTTLNIDSIYFENKLAITPFQANIKQVDDGLNLNMELLNRADDKFVDFNSNIKKDGDDYYFHIKPFNSYFGRKVWSLHPDNLIRLNLKDKSLQVENLELFKDIQSIKFTNSFNDNKSILANFEEVKLEELISGFLPILKTFKGQLNGNIQISDILSNPKPIANLKVSNMMWDSEEIGNLVLTSNLENEIVHSILSLSGMNYKLQSDIYINAKKGIDSLYAFNKLERFKPAILNKILNTLVYDMGGNLHGEFSIFGPLNALNADGVIEIDSFKTGLHTIYTNYNVQNQKIYIKPGKFILDKFKFYDEEGNEAVANGFVNYNHLKRFDLFLDAYSPKLLCINSNALNNSTIYGKVYADANIKFRGTIGDRISILARGRNLPNSILHVNLETAQKTGKYGFYDFIEKDTSNVLSDIVVRKSRKLGGVNLDFDFDVTKDGKLFIIMDPSIEDRIECNGQGRIAFKMTPETDMDIKGSYEIFSGTYLFTYQNLVQRLFYLNKGGTMTFVGDPSAAIIDASATFTTRASAQELISAYFGNTDNSRIISAAKTTVKTNIILKLKNKIMKPDISYELNIDQNNPEVVSAFESITSTTKNNEAELNRQVMGLLLLQRFFPPSFTGFTQNQNPNNAVSSDLQNTAFDVVTGKLSGYVTDWMQNTFKGMNFGLSYKNYNQLNQADNLTNTRNEFKVAISQKLLNDRLVFNVGGNYDFGRGQFSNSNTNTAFFGGDVDLEYLLTPLGNVRAKFYSTLSNDPLNSVYINKTGAGILIQKDFDEFNQLFKKNKMK